MDLRIVNTCNNNCLYCLEWSLRNKEKFISKDLLFTKFLEIKSRDNITFYWGNSLLHNDLLEIIQFCNEQWFRGIWLLSNTYGLNLELLNDLKISWLKTFWFYFNSFNKKNHEIVNWWWISYNSLLINIDLLSKSWLNLKVNIYLNKLNIDSISNDLIILSKKYWIEKIDFIWFFPFDKPYENKEILYFDFNEKRNSINSLFIIIKKLNLKVKFVKFSKDFFCDFIEYYDFQNWVLNQIWEEDIERLNWDIIPFCFKEKRCKYCFIKDKCKFYGI